jgi:pimeloyl-CoA synthetase
MSDNKKFTTYLPTKQIEWLRQTALKETKKRGSEVTAAQILREIIDKTSR